MYDYHYNYIKRKFDAKLLFTDTDAILHSKMQSIKNFDGEENKTGKGVNKNVFKNIKHKEYIDVLINKKVVSM